MIKINGIPIFVEHKNIKHRYIRVLPPDGKVKISVPLNTSDEEIINLVESKMNWITQKIIKVQNREYKIPFKYVTGEKHFLWGKKYILTIVKKKEFKKPFISDDKLFLPVKDNASLEDRQKALLEFYRSEIKSVIPPLLDNAVEVVGKTPNEWRVKNMKTRWGTCNVNKKRIWINLQLAKKPLECLEYVIYHELTHLHVSNHSKEFKRLLTKFYPNSSKIEKILKTNY